jgi:ArsR family transcriptional regulator
MNHLKLKIIQQSVKVLRCISHPQRLRIVECLEKEDLPVIELMRCLKVDQVTVSKHLAVLKEGGIVQSLRRGNFRYNTVVNPRVLKILDCIRKHGDDRK